MTLAEFLLARIAEDEEVARESRMEEHTHQRDQVALRVTTDDGGYSHIQISSGRLLAECQAKRAIVEAAVHADSIAAFPDRDGGRADGLEEALEHLAALWTDHPDYDKAWTPATKTA